MLHKNESTRPGFSRVYLAFAGFYNTYLESELDYMLERDTDYVAEKTGGDDVGERLSAAVNWQDSCEYIARRYCERFGAWLEDALTKLYGDDAPAAYEFTFVKLYRPKDYFYGNDTIEAEIKTADLQRVFSFVMAKDGAGFREYFADRLAPRSGFIPFYPNDVDANGPVESWPACMIQILFDFVDSSARDEFGSYDDAEGWFIEAAQMGGIFEEALCQSDEYAAILNSVE